MSNKETLLPQSAVSRRIAVLRLLLGLVQGVLLYGLYRASKSHSWPADQPLLFAPLLLSAVLLPVLLNSSLGQLQPRSLLRWLLLCGVVLAGLGFYDIWRGASLHAFWGAPMGTPETRLPSPSLWVFSIAGLFIAHALVLAAAQEQRRIASYSRYFETAWKLLIQIKFSAGFVLAIWLALQLGAALFMLVKLQFLQDLLSESWFAIPVTAFAFACGMHITDVRPGIVRGIRSLLLVLLSWILPMAALIVAGFLCSLPFTGLSALWATRHATAVLLGSAALLVVLINTAFQNGEIGAELAMPLRVAGRLAAALLLPLVLIAWYALGLRVQEYGWSIERVNAAACLVVASAYALGYGWAAGQFSVWLDRIAPVNVGAAFLVLAVLLALFSPLADPARLSVADQLSRLEHGRVGADKFDFDYLKFNGGRYGLAALQALSQYTGTDSAAIRNSAAAALQKKDESSATAKPAATMQALRQNIHLWPTTSTLPESFFAQNWNLKTPWHLPDCMFKDKQVCDAFLLDLNRDGQSEIVLLGRTQFSGSAIFMLNEQKKWAFTGSLDPELAGCASLSEQLKSGAYQTIAPRLQDLRVAGQRIVVRDHDTSYQCTK